MVNGTKRLLRNAVLKMSKGTKRQSWNCKMGRNTIKNVEAEKDLGVIIQSNPSPSETYLSKITGEQDRPTFPNKY